MDLLRTKKDREEWRKSQYNLANRELNDRGCFNLINQFFTNLGTVKPKGRINVGNRSVYSREKSRGMVVESIEFLLSRNGEKLLQSYCDVIEHDYERFKDGLLRINRRWIKELS